MSDLKICRICLSTDVKMYELDMYQLRSSYEQIMATKVNEKSGLPKYFCYQCAALLHKYHKFKEKCYIGQKVLKEILWKGPITKRAVLSLDRESQNLLTPISIITVNKRVKTCIIKTAAKLKLHEREPEEVDVGSLSDDGAFEDSIEEKEHLEEVEIEKIEIKEQKEIIEKIETNEIEGIETKQDTDKILEIEKVFTDDELQSDDEKVFVDDIKMLTDDEEEFEPEPEPEPKQTKKRKTRSSGNSKKKKAKETVPKEKKFAVKTTKKTEMDPNNWLKINLTEEEADAEFKARGQHKRYLNAQFKCTECLKGFSKEDMLKRHAKLRHCESNGPIECRFCHMRFKWKCFLNKHMRQHYTKYKCLRCDLVCPLETTALFHEEYHNGVTRKCDHCGEEFKHLTTYYTHLRTHRSEHVCTLCGASFVSAVGLQQHKRIKHVIADIESPDDDEEVNTYCDRCDIRFETRKAFEEHLFHSALHDNNESNSPDMQNRKVLGKKEQAKIRNRVSKRITEEDEFKVSEERKPSRKTRRKHKKPTTCHQCGKHFNTQSECWKHHLAEHPGTSFFSPNERYICEICGSSLAPGSVASHQNMHTRSKLFSCDTCGKQFHAIMGLKRHLVTHTGEKPYACSLCSKRFTQSNSMKLHYRTFHLKEPYPKRNRRKNKDEPKTKDFEETNSDKDSEDSLPDLEPEMRTEIEPVTSEIENRPDESMHYLTLV